jgi:hypothetical protein
MRDGWINLRSLPIIFFQIRKHTILGEESNIQVNAAAFSTSMFMK